MFLVVIQKRKGGDDDSSTAATGTSNGDEPMRKMMRQFKQRQTVATSALVDE
jgi:hypothetical protein